MGQSSNVTVTVNPLPFVVITTSQQIIQEGESVTLTATPSGNGPFTLEWTDGFVQTNVTGPVQRVVHPTVTTTYNATIIDANGCAYDPPVGVTIYVGPVSPIIAAIIAKYCPL